ncbi:MAG: carboxypeptidase-like regulatory domain-containing protein [Acidobacteriota bacterium]
MNVAHLAVVALLAQTSSAPQPPATVIHSGTGQPLPGARVQLFRVRAQGPQSTAPPVGRDNQPPGFDEVPHSATTAQDGRFVFDQVKPGEYRLVATRSGGYVPGEYGQRSATGLGISFELSAGQQMRNVQLLLTPTAAISGRVYDREGPVGKLQVQALKPVYRDGQRMLTIVQSVQTDDRGEYRLFWLPPGSYYITARPFTGRDANQTIISSGVHISEPLRVGTFEQASSPVITSRTLSSGEVMEETQVPVYYPGRTDVGAATRIDLRSGSSADGVDIALTTGVVRTRRIRGVVLANGQPVAAAGLTAIPRTGDPSLLIPSGQTTADGSFDIAGVVPGAYFVFARTNPGMTGGLALQVGDADVDNLVIPVTSGARVTGRFVIDGRARSGGDLDMAVLRATLRRDPDVIGMPQAGPTFSPPPAPDGSFELQGVPPGDFRVSVRALPPDAYIKSMRLGGVDVLDGGLHIAGAPRDTLEIVIGANGGGLTGTAVNARQEPVSNATVVVVPGPADRHRIDLYRSTTTDNAGRFHIRGLAGGRYAAFAWTAIEAGAWMDPEIVRSYESHAKSIAIRDGNDETIQLTAIAAR